MAPTVPLSEPNPLLLLLLRRDQQQQAANQPLHLPQRLVILA